MADITPAELPPKHVYIMAPADNRSVVEVARRLLREAGMFPINPHPATLTPSLAQAISVLTISRRITPVGAWHLDEHCLRVRQIADWMGVPSVYLISDGVRSMRAQSERLVALTGAASSGKSTVAQYMAQELGYVVRAIGDRIRSMIESTDLEIDGRPISSILRESNWEQAKRSNPRVRELQQLIATEGVRHHFGHDTWINSILMQRNYPWVVIPDCRLRVEVDAVRRLGGAVMRVEKTGIGPVNAHHTENDLTADNYDYDAIIHNAGSLEELHSATQIELNRFWG